jgi:hypothetical protein
MTKEQAIEFLMKDGDLPVPCCRYGRNTSECAEVAWAAETILFGETGEGMTKNSLEVTMGLVVNDSGDIEYLIMNYGAEYGFSEKELLSV